MPKYAPFPPLLDQYKTEIWDRQREIDPDDACDWSSMAYGWAIAKGQDPEAAWNFAYYVTSNVLWETPDA